MVSHTSFQGGSSENDPALKLDFHDFLFSNGTVKLEQLINQINDINEKQKKTANDNVERIDDVSFETLSSFLIGF